MDNQECRKLMEKFIKEHPELLNEDIGEYTFLMPICARPGHSYIKLVAVFCLS
jgi:hypothetical protein